MNILYKVAYYREKAYSIDWAYQVQLELKHKYFMRTEHIIYHLTRTSEINVELSKIDKYVKNREPFPLGIGSRTIDLNEFKLTGINGFVV